MSLGRFVIGPLGGLCAVLSTALLLVDNVQFMRLGIVLALWAAAFATIVVAWVRRDLRVAEDELLAARTRLEAIQKIDADAPVSAITA